VPSATLPIQIMGILNVTPDSFSDGGQFNSLERALVQAERMLLDGAHWLDIGGESTRPGAKAVSVQEELDRVIPVVERLKSEFKVNISVDTSKPEVMSAAIVAGADMINDVKALREPGALKAVAQGDSLVCLMHMQGEPRTMQEQPYYEDVVNEVKAFLEERVRACETLGIHRNRIYIDPGFGFGKSLRHNYELLQRLQALHELNLPLLIGISRKSMLGAVTGKEVHERLSASVAAATIAAMKGAQILRVHDVAETKDAVQVVAATLTGDC